MIQIELAHEDAKLPTRGSEQAAGLDLYIVEDVVIPPGKQAAISTGIKMSIPAGYVGLIWPRSKLAVKKNTDILAGVVDSDYRGIIHVAIVNHDDKPLELRKGDKAAQMVIQAHYTDFPLREVTNLDETLRGEAGITSTDIRLRD